MTEQAEPIERQRIGDLQHVERQPLERVRARVLRMGARAVSSVIEGDHSGTGRQRVDVIAEVVLQPAEPVDQDHRRPRPRDPSGEPHPVVGRDVDFAHVAPRCGGGRMVCADVRNRIGHGARGSDGRHASVISDDADAPAT